ncbi:MAG TPA: sigma-70 family RNA polymerase sigma factor [Rudaea sp.]|nr:sigma-70 family RNA polymerase sigma factor [Rudaea sp.]
MVSASAFQIDLPQSLVERVRRGDAIAFEQVYRRFERPVYTLALRMLGDAEAARDTLHDAMLKAYQRAHQFRGDAPFWAWLRQIALNEVLMRLRIGERFIVSMESAGLDADAFADDAPAPWAHADARALEHALAQLPAITRSVLWLYHVEGYTHPEIAAAMRKTTSFSKSQLARGIARLRAILDPEIVEPETEVESCPLPTS